MASTAIVLLCGLPGSGKTTLVTTLRRLWTESWSEVAVRVLSVDELCEKAVFDASDWHAARKKVTESARLELESGRSGCQLVLIDDTMFYRSMRRRFFLLATELHSAFRIVYVQCRLEICLKRNAQRENPVPESVLSRAAAVFEPPDGSKAYWEKDTLVCDSTVVDLRDALACKGLAERLMRDWEAAKKLGVDSEVQERRSLEGAEANRQARHQLDLRTRSLVSQAIQQAKAEGETDLSALSKTLSQLRAQHLASINVGRTHEEAEDTLEAAVEAFAAAIEAEKQIHIS